MSAGQEHEMIPVIRDWLAATWDVEIPLGLSREQSHRQARTFLSAIALGTVGPDTVEIGDELRDILWATVDELDEKPPGQPTLEQCDRFYQFVAGLPLENDPFDELGEILHRVARIGWRSAPGGLEAALKARDALWEHGDEQRHRMVCETANRLPARISELKAQEALELTEIRETCWRLVKLTGICPAPAVSAAAALIALLASRDRRIGLLDDREHLKAVTELAAAMACRHLGQWDQATKGYARAAASFRRTAETSDLERVKADRLAIEQVRGAEARVAEIAPALIRTLVIPRDRLKAQIVLGEALINLDRPEDARAVLEEALQNVAVENEPAFNACLLTKLGIALSQMGDDAKAVSAFNSAGAILKRFSHPAQLADLTGAVGEHLGKLGQLKEAAALYLAARAEFQRIGQGKFVGYYSVLIAELMVLLGKDEEAEAELRAALPLIERFELRREAAAAVALLREAIANRRNDVTMIRALREQLRKGLY